MTFGLMRRVPPLNLIRLRTYALSLRPPPSQGALSLYRQHLNPPSRSLAQVRDDKTLSEVWFTSARPSASPVPSNDDCPQQKPPDERTLKLGKTIEILHDRLPVLLATPLPQEILSPQISLHLFPSTHPHLPTVTGKIAYSAALWTAPVAWGRVPVVGNVRLIILSERMVKNGQSNFRYRNEKLIVRWRTCGKTQGRGMGALYRGIYGSGDQVDKITEYLGGDVRDDEEFSGLFIFEFDEEGRIVEHTIEHAQEGRNFEKMTRVVSVTDWLIGLAKGKKRGDEHGFALGYCEVDQRDPRRRIQDRRKAGDGQDGEDGGMHQT